MTSDRQVSRTIVTDDEGRFNFVALPAGRYMLTANKQGYVARVLWSAATERPGTALVLAEDQRITGLMLRMTRGSAISGVLVDHNGEPFSGANVSAMRNQFVGSWPALAPSGGERGVGRPRAIPTVGTCRRRLRDLGERGVRFADSGH